jgi:dephospho-CoA kinase
MTKIIGLTGGIGSGKTTVANYFKTLGVPVYIADDEAKKIMESPQILNAIREKFGESIFEGNRISRERLANIVFKDPKRLKELNEIIHPAVKKHFKEWLQQHTDAPFIIKEAAILFESGSYKDCDQIITVVAPLETRMERVLKRDHTTKEQVLNRIHNQWSDEMRIAKSDYVIDNIDLALAKQQVNKIAEKLTIQ